MKKRAILSLILCGLAASALGACRKKDSQNNSTLVYVHSWTAEGLGGHFYSGAQMGPVSWYVVEGLGDYLRTQDYVYLTTAKEITHNEEKRSIVSLGELNSNCLISLDFMVNDDKGDFGIYLNENENFEYYYLARFDAQFNRLSLDKWPRYDRTKYLHVDSERPSSVSLKQINHVDVIVQDSVLEVYVNGKVAMSERMFEKGKTFGLYASNVDVEFKNDYLNPFHC